MPGRPAVVRLFSDAPKKDGLVSLGNALSMATDAVVSDLRGRTLRSNCVLDEGVETIFLGSEDIGGSICSLACERRL